MKKIEWTDWTWNPAWGCRNTCGYCYARTVARRFAAPIAAKELALEHTAAGITPTPDIEERLRTFAPTWLQTNFERAIPKRAGRIFVNSMSDFAHWEAQWQALTLQKIAEHPTQQFQILTKTPEKLIDIEFPENVILGVSAENQPLANIRLAALFKIKAHQYFLSAEPMLGPIVLSAEACEKLNWIVVGGMTAIPQSYKMKESLGGATNYTLQTHWVEALANQCAEAKIPFFFKSWGQRSHGRELMRREFPAFFGKVDSSAADIKAFAYKSGTTYEVTLNKNWARKHFRGMSLGERKPLRVIDKEQIERAGQLIADNLLIVGFKFSSHGNDECLVARITRRNVLEDGEILLNYAPTKEAAANTVAKGLKPFEPYQIRATDFLNMFFSDSLWAEIDMKISPEGEVLSVSKGQGLHRFSEFINQ